MAIARRQIVYGAPVPIAAAAVRAWNTTPIEIAPAPGTNRIILPLGYLGQYLPGVYPFGVTDIDNEFFSWTAYLDTGHTTASTALLNGANSTLLSQTTERIETGVAAGLAGLIAQINDGFVGSAVKNKPLLLKGTNDLQGGQIATATLNAAGLLYAQLDTGHIIQGTNTSATYRIDTVGGGGAVATFTITNPGANYTTATGLSTDTSGGGSGFKVNITAINKGDGSLIVTPTYTIVRLS